eukprot:766846-Prymnesium_polylepis.1
MRDRRSIALRSQWCVRTPRARACSPGGPHPAAPGGKDASPGHWRACPALVCRLSGTYSEVPCSTYIYRAFCSLRCLDTDPGGHARLTGRLAF